MTEQEAMKFADGVEESIRRASHGWGPDDVDEATTIIYSTLCTVFNLENAVRASSPEATCDHLSALASRLSREAMMVREYKESRWQDSYMDYRNMHW
jgi:hypothetical protein